MQPTPEVWNFNRCQPLELVRSFPEGLENAEATNAVSKTDYRAKSFIALKEARESLYWLDLLHETKYLDDKQFESLHSGCKELIAILVTIIKKLKDNPKGQK